MNSVRSEIFTATTASYSRGWRVEVATSALSGGSIQKPNPQKYTYYEFSDRRIANWWFVQFDSHEFKSEMATYKLTLTWPSTWDRGLDEGKKYKSTQIWEYYSSSPNPGSTTELQETVLGMHHYMCTSTLHTGVCFLKNRTMVIPAIAGLTLCLKHCTFYDHVRYFTLKWQTNCELVVCTIWFAWVQIRNGHLQIDLNLAFNLGSRFRRREKVQEHPNLGILQ